MTSLGLGTDSRKGDSEDNSAADEFREGGMHGGGGGGPVISGKLGLRVRCRAPPARAGAKEAVLRCARSVAWGVARRVLGKSPGALSSAPRVQGPGRGFAPEPIAGLHRKRGRLQGSSAPSSSPTAFSSLAFHLQSHQDLEVVPSSSCVTEEFLVLKMRVSGPQNRCPWECRVHFESWLE